MNRTARTPPLEVLKRLRGLLTEINRRPDLTERERRVLTALALQTIGYGRRSDFVAVVQLVDRTGIDESHVWRTLKSLKKKGLVRSEGGGFRKGHVARRWIVEEALHEWPIQPPYQGGQSGHLCTPGKGGRSGRLLGGQSGQTPFENGVGDGRKQHVSHTPGFTSNNNGRRGSLNAPPVNVNNPAQEPEGGQ